MLWVLVIASIIGFLAVTPVSQFLPINTLLEQDFASHLGLNYILLFVIFISMIVYFFVQKQSVILDNQFSITDIVKQKLPKTLLLIWLFLLTLISSLSVGLYDYQQYQNNLLKQKLSLTATIKVNQLSDSVSQIIDVNNQPTIFGNSYPRQIWQIIHVDDFAGDDKLLTKINNINVLASVDISKNPDYQLILKQLKPNDMLKVSLDIMPINQQNFDNLPKNAKIISIGFDENNYLRQRHVQALATVTQMDKNSLSEFNLNQYPMLEKNLAKDIKLFDNLLIKIEKLRWQLRQNIQQNFIKTIQADNIHDNQTMIQKNLNNHAILLGLLTGDRALMMSDIKNRYQQAGISHLLAISGPHVLMLASVVSLWVLAFVKYFLPNLLCKLPSRLLVLWVSVLVAWFYALLVGFELPAQRTFWLLLLTTLASQFLINNRPFLLLASVGLVMMWWDTTAVQQAGFWLSFVAVGLLMKFSEQVGNMNNIQIFEKSDTWQSDNSIFERIWLKIKQEFVLLFKLQLWLFVLMFPIVIWFFGKISLVSVVVNLFAVPFLGLVVVPLDMLAGILSLLPVVSGLGGVIWGVLGGCLAVFHAVLDFVLQFDFSKQLFVYISQSQSILCVLLAVILASRGILSKIFMLPIFAMIALIFITQKQDNLNNPKLIVLKNTQINIQLLLIKNQSWLILSDNKRIYQDTNKLKNNQQKQQDNILTTGNDNEKTERVLNNDIYPILAKYHVNTLTGVISQTPTDSTNQIVQHLARKMTISQYYLAGFDAIKPLKNEQNQAFTFDNITPKSCRAEQVIASDDDFSLTALTGWQLNLSDSQISQKERHALQTCFLQINSHDKNKQNQQVSIIGAGSDSLPMQMSMMMYSKACLTDNVDLFISPFALRFDKDWLISASPKQLHVVTGRFDNQKFNENNQFDLLALKAKPKVLQSDDVGVVEYQLNVKP
ncbi:ComEC/Rec2 family competence protein [Faucicola mancuniensis]|uniref:ComEC/Rec2 family competence protein n=1 Tax=Faucicola mancuniensis TaxID=1309795 RepID=UPI0039779E85